MKVKTGYFLDLLLDDLVKSRHSGENRSPAKLEPIDITVFRPSPELRKMMISNFLRDHHSLNDIISHLIEGGTYNGF